MVREYLPISDIMGTCILFRFGFSFNVYLNDREGAMSSVPPQPFICQF